MHRYIHIFDHRFLSYDIMTILGLIVAYAYLYYAFTRLDIPKKQIFLFFILGYFVQYLGGMIIPFMHGWIYYDYPPWLNVWEKSPGRYFHSAFLSMMVFVMIMSKAFKWPMGKAMDHFIIAALIMSSIGRIGCYMQGCCAGKATTIFCAVKFPQNPHVYVHPTQIYMNILEVGIWTYLIMFNKEKKFDGETFWRGVLIYSVYRFGIEFLRTNPVFVAYMTHAQVFSILTFLISGTVIIFKRRSLKAASSQ